MRNADHPSFHHLARCTSRRERAVGLHHHVMNRLYVHYRQMLPHLKSEMMPYRRRKERETETRWIKYETEDTEATRRRMEKRREFVWLPESTKSRETSNKGLSSKSSVCRTIGGLNGGKTITPNKRPQNASRYDHNVQKLQPQIIRSVQCVMPGAWNGVKPLIRYDVWKPCITNDWSVVESILQMRHILIKKPNITTDVTAMSINVCKNVLNDINLWILADTKRTRPWSVFNDAILGRQPAPSVGKCSNDRTKSRQGKATAAGDTVTRK